MQRPQKPQKARRLFAASAQSGKWVGGPVPYGYRLDPEKGLSINEGEALLVKKMFKMYAFGLEGAFTITNKLNEAGHRKRSGKKWDKRIVLHMFIRPSVVLRPSLCYFFYESRQEKTR